MFQDKKIRVTPDNVKPGEKYNGYEYVGGTCYSSITIQKDGSAISYNKWPISEEKEIIYFFRDMTYDEEREWYINQTNLEDNTNKLNLIGLHTDLHSVGDAPHEMWNGWVKYEWRRQILDIRDEDFFIVGIAPAPYGCMAISDPVAMVAEYKDTGDRFWCHANRMHVEKMRDKSKIFFDEIMQDMCLRND